MVSAVQRKAQRSGLAAVEGHTQQVPFRGVVQADRLHPFLHRHIQCLAVRQGGPADTHAGIAHGGVGPAAVQLRQRAAARAVQGHLIDPRPGGVHGPTGAQQDQPLAGHAQHVSLISPGRASVVLVGAIGIGAQGQVLGGSEVHIAQQREDAGLILIIVAIAVVLLQHPQGRGVCRSGHCPAGRFRDSRFRAGRRNRTQTGRSVAAGPQQPHEGQH